MSSLKEALQVLDNAGDIFLTYCSCKKGAGGECDYRCLFINYNASIQKKLSANENGRFIDKDEAIEIVKEHRRNGHFNSVMWGLRTKVGSLCNCDHYCAGLYVPEIRWGLIPSFKISRVKNPEKCDPDCDICLQTCYAKAILKPEKQKVIQVDEKKCIGCNLCVKNCPYGVFESVPRKVYYAAAIDKKVELKE